MYRVFSTFLGYSTIKRNCRTKGSAMRYANKLRKAKVPYIEKIWIKKVKSNIKK